MNQFTNERDWAGRAASITVAALARAARDLGALTPEATEAIEAAAAAESPASPGPGGFSTTLAHLAAAGGITPEALSCGLPASGLESLSAHLSVTLAIKWGLLPTLYRHEAALGSTAAAAVVARARHRIGQAAENLREVALVDPPADGRYGGPMSELAGRVIGYVNTAARTQLRQTTLPLPAGATQDALAEAEALLRISLEAIASATPTPTAEAAARPTLELITHTIAELQAP
jgi:hypothetical protein